jgi:pyrimidine/purine-5'-nucleotide nucleosidase
MPTEAAPNQNSDVVKGPIRVTPFGHFTSMLPSEVKRIKHASENGAHKILRDCSLAVLNAGAVTDDSTKLFDRYSDFELKIEPSSYGVNIILENAPASAFTRGRELIRGYRSHLYAVLRDVTYFHTVDKNDKENVQKMLQNARLLEGSVEQLRDRVACWGGHSIDQEEYTYSKSVGYELALLNGVDMITGCGAGVMKGPMKGAHIGHGKQQIYDPNYIGFTEPGIVAAEPPNAMVNNLVIFPNIEQRLEAFVRTAHGIIIFPGGVGTAEELQYILGILMHPGNTKDDPYLPIPVILTAPETSRDYMDRLDDFIRNTLGEDAGRRYEKIIGDPKKVAERMKDLLKRVRESRLEHNENLRFNNELFIPDEFKTPFDATHDNVAKLRLDESLHDNKSSFAAGLRRAFSAIVAGNIKHDTVRLVREHGKFQITGPDKVAQALNTLLNAFREQGRMKMEGEYTPCYDIVSRNPLAPLSGGRTP